MIIVTKGVEGVGLETHARVDLVCMLSHRMGFGALSNGAMFIPMKPSCHSFVYLASGSSCSKTPATVALLGRLGSINETAVIK